MASSEPSGDEAWGLLAKGGTRLDSCVISEGAHCVDVVGSAALLPVDNFFGQRPWRLCCTVSAEWLLPAVQWGWKPL